jgi:uncharacterized protein (UPF0333 family)
MIPLKIKIYIGGLILAVLTASSFAAFFYYQGKEAARTQIIIRTIEKAKPIMEKKNEIRNTRPSFTTMANRMRQQRY